MLVADGVVGEGVALDISLTVALAAIDIDGEDVQTAAIVFLPPFDTAVIS